MFKSQSKMAKSSDSDGVLRNHLAAGTSVKGDIVTTGDIRIDGNVDGSVVADGKLVVGNTGKITGNIQATTSNVSGAIEGVMDVAEMLKVQATGKISGEITYGKLMVEPGAELEGRLTIKGKVKAIANGQQSDAKREKTA